MKKSIQIKRLSLYEISVLLGFTLFPFYGMLSNVNHMFLYIDEYFFILTVGNAFLKYARIKTNKANNNCLRIVVYLFFFTMIIALISNIFNRYQTSIYAIIMDMLSWCKFVLVFILGYLVMSEKNIRTFYNRFVFLSKITIIWNLVLVVANQVLDLEIAGKAVRFGIIPYAIPGMHVAFTVGFFAIIASLFMLDYQKNKLWIVCTIIICLATARVKGFGWVAVVLSAIIFMRKKGKLLPIVIAMCAVALVARETFETYFFNEGASRNLEMAAAIRMARDCFPLGGGFASIGTTMSFQRYSAAYDLYGLSSRYGYMRSAGAFIGDGGWSTQIGQFGCIGVILFAVVIIKICKICILKGQVNQRFLPSISIVSYLLIASVSERIFSGDLASLLAIVMVIICKFSETRGNQNEIRAEKKRLA